MAAVIDTLEMKDFCKNRCVAIQQLTMGATKKLFFTAFLLDLSLIY